MIDMLWKCWSVSGFGGRILVMVIPCPHIDRAHVCGQAVPRAK